MKGYFKEFEGNDELDRSKIKAEALGKSQEEGEEKGFLGKIYKEGEESEQVDESTDLKEVKFKRDDEDEEKSEKLINANPLIKEIASDANQNESKQ